MSSLPPPPPDGIETDGEDILTGFSIIITVLVGFLLVLTSTSFLVGVTSDEKFTFRLPP